MLHQHDAVAADAVVTVGKTCAERFGAGYLPFKVVEENIIVAAALHFYK